MHSYTNPMVSRGYQSPTRRVLFRLEADLYDRVRMAAEVHRQVRKYAQSFIEPGIKLIDMCEMIENKNRELIQVSTTMWIEPESRN
jgi:hypothetical protein